MIKIGTSMAIKGVSTDFISCFPDDTASTKVKVSKGDFYGFEGFFEYPFDTL
jgi:hypothetical protein